MKPSKGDFQAFFSCVNGKKMETNNSHDMSCQKLSKGDRFFLIKRIWILKAFDETTEKMGIYLQFYLNTKHLKQIKRINVPNLFTISMCKFHALIFDYGY